VGVHQFPGTRNHSIMINFCASKVLNNHYVALSFVTGHTVDVVDAYRSGRFDANKTRPIIVNYDQSGIDLLLYRIVRN